MLDYQNIAKVKTWYLNTLIVNYMIGWQGNLINVHAHNLMTVLSLYMNESI